MAGDAMRTSAHNNPGQRGQRGVGVIEILIGMLIGMLAMVVIFQVVEIGDSKRRTVGSGSESQVAGNFALYTLDRDLQHAGYGLGKVPADYLGCNVRAYNGNRSAYSRSFNFPLYPVAITQGTSTAPDSLSVLIGGSAIVPLRQTYDGSTTTTKHLISRAGYLPPTASANGDIFLALSMNPAAQCAMLQVSGVGADDFTIEHSNATNAPYNPTTALASLGTDGILLNLGRAPRLQRWAVNTTTNTFEVSNLFDTTPTAVPVADGVVDLQAEYAVDDGAGGTTWTESPTAAQWSRLVGVRLAVVIRGQQMEREVVTTTASAPRWVAAGRTLTGVMATANWDHYRYRVYETTVSFRNVLWSK